MKILIIGASGMLAKPAIDQLDKKGFQLRLFSRSVNQSMFPKDYEIMKGDVFKLDELEKAVQGCDAIHINLSGPNEAKAVQGIVHVALKANVNLISTISGCTVSEENRWFPMINDKFGAEQSIIHSGIPYLIFRASWFFESLGLMVRNGKATIIGRQNNPYHWIAARDYARMLGEAYLNTKSRNKIFYVLGQEPYIMKDLLNKYCEVQYPEIKKIKTISTGMLNIIARITHNKELKTVSEMFRYFEKTKETGNPDETYALLGNPEISFEKWLQLKD